MEPPKLPSLFKIPKHKRFSYKPRYYDPEAEERKEKLKKLQENRQDDIYETNENNQYKKTISFRSAWREQYQREKHRQTTSNLRLIGIIIILLFLTYLLLK